MFQLKRTKLEKKHQLKQHTKCKVDIVYFAEHYVNISTTDRGIHKIELYDFQKRVLNEFADKEYSRNSILLAGRQATTTTLVAIYILHHALFNEDKIIIALTKTHQHSRYLKKVIKLFYDELPEWLKPGIEHSEHHIKFGKGSVITFRKPSIGYKVHDVSLLFIDDHENQIHRDFLYDVVPSILANSSPEVIFTSYKSSDVYRKALAGENNFKPIKINWWEIPGRSESWKRDMIKHIGRDNFNKEFECLTTTQT
jgi:hypothetical protein